ncbi:MAG TPA: histidinol-phosphatase, partial [Lacibacter sp.]|nr:histidinol-phosphatase [Lacibacter sp.]
MKRVLFIDRDGTLNREAPPTYQIDSWDKLDFYPGVFRYLGRIADELDYELVMVTNQDGLGTASFPEEQFWPIQQHIVRSLANEGIHFKAVYIDRTFAHEQAPTRKPGTALLQEYLNNPAYDLANSYVIGDRITDVQLANNLGARAIWMNQDPELGAAEISNAREELKAIIALESADWSEIYRFLKLGLRQVTHERTTHETNIRIGLNLDGSGRSNIRTGLGF